MITKPAEEKLNEATLANSAITTAADCESQSLVKAASLCVEGVVTFHASATGDVRFHVRASTTDTDAAFDDAVDIGADQDGYFDVPCDAGETVRASAPFGHEYLNIRIFAENLDGTYAATNVIANVIVQDIEPT